MDQLYSTLYNLFPVLKRFRMNHSNDLAKAQRHHGDLGARRNMKSGQSKGLSERERLDESIGRFPHTVDGQNPAPPGMVKTL